MAHFCNVTINFLNLDGWFSVLPNKLINFWYSIIMLLYQSQILISSFLSFFRRYTSLFMYLFIKSFVFNCLWTIMQISSWGFHNFISHFVNNEITSCLCSFLNCSFWNSFKCICCRLFSIIKNFLPLLANIFLLAFYQYFCQYF